MYANNLYQQTDGEMASVTGPLLSGAVELGFPDYLAKYHFHISIYISDPFYFFKIGNFQFGGCKLLAGKYKITNGPRA